MSECKHCAMESSHCHYCCDGTQIDMLKKENAALRGACQIYSEMVRNAYNEAYENRSCPLSCIEAFRGSRVGERMKVLENRLYGSQS